MKVKFGKIINTYTIDPEGSTVTEEQNMNQGVPIGALKRRIEMRVRVKNRVHEFEEYMLFSESLKPDMLDPVFKIENNDPTKDYYHVVKCWTKIEK